MTRQERRGDGHHIKEHAHHLQARAADTASHPELHGEIARVQELGYLAG